MIRTCAFSLLAATCLVSCVQSGPYHPVTKPEAAEYARTQPAIYPDEVRANLSRYTNTPIVWVGIIRSSDAQEEDTTTKLRLDSVCDHHYFDWHQTGGLDTHLKVSARGEGRFRCRWYLRRTEKYIDVDLQAQDAEKYAAPGKLAIFYGTPESVDPDGTIVLKYHYMRVLSAKDYTTNGVTYGRLGEWFQGAINRQ